eukprot:Selendium_serpulae@DN9415_c0_g1_i1.p2
MRIFLLLAAFPLACAQRPASSLRQSPSRPDAQIHPLHRARPTQAAADEERFAPAPVRARPNTLIEPIVEEPSYIPSDTCFIDVQAYRIRCLRAEEQAFQSNYAAPTNNDKDLTVFRDGVEYNIAVFGKGLLQ